LDSFHLNIIQEKMGVEFQVVFHLYNWES